MAGSALTSKASLTVLVATNVRYQLAILLRTSKPRNCRLYGNALLVIMPVMNWIDLDTSSLTGAKEVLWLFLIPVGGGIPSGVIAAKGHGIGWPLMTVLYVVSDMILALVFESLMLGLIAAAKRNPRLVRIVDALKQPAERACARFGANLGPLALVMVSFGVDPMTGRATAKAMGHGFFSGWAIAIAGDMLFFGIIAYSTLSLNAILNETWTTLIILAAMFIGPGLFRKVKALCLLPVGEPSMAKIATYEEFWPYYLTQHAQPLTRKLHALGAVLAVALLVLATIQQKWVVAALAPVAAYGVAWFSHFFIEHNRPATWDYPLWSLRSEGRMAWGVLCGKL